MTTQQNETSALAAYTDTKCKALTPRRGAMMPCGLTATHDDLCDEHYERKQTVGR